MGLPRWLNGKESACQCRRQSRHDFNPWVRKIPWRRKWQPTRGFLPGKSHGQKGLAGHSPWGCKKSDMTYWLNTHACLSNEQAKSSDWYFWFCKTEMHVLSLKQQQQHCKTKLTYLSKLAEVRCKWKLHHEWHWWWKGDCTHFSLLCLTPFEHLPIRFKRGDLWKSKSDLESLSVFPKQDGKEAREKLLKNCLCS